MKSSSCKMLFASSHHYLKKSISLFFITFLLFSCHKEKERSQIDGVTGFTWKVYSVQHVSDNFINPIPTGWELNLNASQNFTFKLGSTVCSGTYSWTAIDSTVAHVTFSISQWNTPSQSPEIADKLKTVIQSMDKCYSYKAPFPGQYPGPPLYAAMVLQFQGSDGYFYVYR